MDKILIIEDSPVISGLAKDFLERNKYTVSAALDGLEGLEKAKQELPDLILLDIMLPDIDGFEVLKKLKADPLTSHIPVIMLSTKSDTEALLKTESLGASDFLIKPTEPDVFLKTIRKNL